MKIWWLKLKNGTWKTENGMGKSEKLNLKMGVWKWKLEIEKKKLENETGKMNWLGLEFVMLLFSSQNLGFEVSDFEKFVWDGDNLKKRILKSLLENNFCMGRG